MSPPILFDMDGVILEGARTPLSVYRDATGDALVDLGVEPSPDQRRVLDGHDIERITDHSHDLGIDPVRYWKLRERYASERTHDRIRSGVRGLYDDVDAIADLGERTSISLVSNNRQQTVEFVADYVEVEFDVVRGRDPTFEGFRRRKPNPYYIEESLAELGAETGIYVGDSQTDVEAGHAAGLETALIRRPHNRDLECPDPPTEELESLRELLDFV
ncbi:HAD family hydrolase [Natrarchaeobius halalkaliphilus]|uniref:HAD family hydrolase n=1 Tax=Natrarchaeobius halalkaliphilus TaxID=1679091 RepID=A0A3N6MUD8_9EURY|nr:HAD-IA family hydrolase [Natrarchaeobius halalkaliphilus]RQG88992.1 HAD family hydrolase [Natrarchaeobius halalkaliphilus]